MPCIWICGAAAGVFLVASVIKLLQVWFVNRPARRVDFASYRSANWNIADPQHFRSQQISGEETGTSNIINSRNSRNNNSPDMNQSNNCRNYETHHQNASDLQKTTRCDERVNEVTPEGTDQIHSAPSSRLESAYDRDRSHSDSSNGSLNTPAGISRSSPVNIDSDALNQTSSLANEVEGIQDALRDMKANLLEVQTGLQTDQLSRSCSRQSEISRRGPPRKDNSYNDNSRSLEEHTGSQASISSNSGERHDNLDPRQVRLNLTESKNFFEDGSRPQNSLKTLPNHLEQSSHDNNGIQSVVSVVEVPTALPSRSRSTPDSDRSYSDSPKGSLYRPSSISSSSPANIDNDTVSQSSKIVKPEEKSYNKRASTRHSINVGKGSSKISACPMPTASIAPKRYSRNQIRFGDRSLSSRQDNDAETQSRMRRVTSPLRIISDLVLNRNGNYVELIRKKRK